METPTKDVDPAKIAAAMKLYEEQIAQRREKMLAAEKELLSIPKGERPEKGNATETVEKE